MSNHNPIIDTKPFVRSIYLSTAVSRRDGHHVLETLVAANTADSEDLLRSDAGHGAFGDSNEHCKDGFLDGEAEVLLCDELVGAGIG
jgi:hypothetical protein